MTGRTGGVVILLDPAVRATGLDPGALTAAVGAGREAVVRQVPGLARGPARAGEAARSAAAARAVLVTAEYGDPTLAELRSRVADWGLDPLGVHCVALDVLASGRSPAEQAGYAVRLVTAGLAALAASGESAAARRALGSALSRRGLLTGRMTTWAPVAAVAGDACLGSARCGRCLPACPVAALTQGPNPGQAPAVDPAACTACGRCVASCPVGALRLDGLDPGPLGRRLTALLDGGADELPAPALVFACESIVGLAHRAGRRRGSGGWLPVALPHVAGLGSGWLLAALAAGARAVGVLPCSQCRSDPVVAERVEFVRALLGGLGDGAGAARAGVLPDSSTEVAGRLAAAGQLAPLCPPVAGALGPLADLAPGRDASLAAWAVTRLAAALAALTPAPEPTRRSSTAAPRMGSGPGTVVTGAGSPLGLVAARVGGCTGCGACTLACPGEALVIRHEGPPHERRTLVVFDPASCDTCRLCVSACPEQVLQATAATDVRALRDGPVVIAVSTGGRACPTCGQDILVLPAARLPAGLPTPLMQKCPTCRVEALTGSALT